MDSVDSVSAPSASARRLNPQHASRRKAAAALAGQLHLRVASGVHDNSAPGCSLSSTVQSIGAKLSAIGQQRHLHVCQQLDLTQQAVASTISAASARPIAISIAPYAKRVSILQRLH